MFKEQNVVYAHSERLIVLVDYKIILNTTVKKTCNISDLRSPQLSVVRAYYGYCQSTGPITPINIENLKMLERTGFAPQ